MATLHSAVDPNRDHIAGNENASVTLVEYGDYECPHCGSAYPIVERLREALGDRLRFVYRHFPLSEMHPHASRAAQAAESAGAQGKFWEMHAQLFAHQQALGDAQLATYATQAGADGAKVTDDLNAGAYAEHVHEDFLGGVRSGVNGTPTFFINGKRHDDSWDEETLLAALQDA